MPEQRSEGAIMYIRMPILALILFLVGCASLVAPYDATFDQSLNKLSSDTATFLAAASAGGSERSYSSDETVAYYAATYNLLDRLSQRASLSRGAVPCPTNASLIEFAGTATSTTTLPADYREFDCREFQLYSVRIYVDQMHYAHEKGGSLNRSEATALGNTLQTSVMGAIETFVVNKPQS